MHQFKYHQGALHCEEVNLETLARDYGTPLYVYSSQTLRNNYKSLNEALGDLDHHIAFAVKANSNLSVLRLLAELGSGFDIVSGGELFRVVKAGGDPQRCSFAGVGKTTEEIRYALEQGIYCFNIESLAELEFINNVAESTSHTAPVAVRINPNVDAQTHKYISTGKAENKFGIDYEETMKVYERASALPHIQIKGIQMHIGSQLTNVSPFVEAVKRVIPLVGDLQEKYGIEFFSIGGGIGIVYEDALASGPSSWWSEQEDPPLSPDVYARELVPLLAPLKMKIVLEPGRYMSGNAGVLLTSCLYEKKGSAKTFKIVDAGMNDLIRPALYEGHHEIVPVLQNQSKTTIVGDVVGPICESGDFFCQNREIADVQRGDLIALMSAGAYSFTMASNYNSRPLPAEILVDGTRSTVARKRQEWSDLVAGEL